MNQKPDTRKLKQEARSLLTGRHAFLAGATALTSVISLFLNYLSTRIASNTSSITGLLLMLAASVLLNIVYYLILAGQHRLYLNLCRDGQPRLSDLFSCFTWRPEPVAVYSLLQFALSSVVSNLYVWFLAKCLLSVTDSGAEVGLTDLLIVLAVLAVNIWLQISLSMVLFLYCDNPERNVRTQIRNSFRLMKGMRLRFFYLELSFFGMYLLSTLSFGIGLLFVQPYILTSETLFYEEICGQNQTAGESF